MFPAAEADGGTRLRIARTVDALRRDGQDIELIVRHSRGEAADVVAALAGELGADLIVCGTRGLDGLAGTFLGSFTYRLLHVATCPVLAVHDRGPAAEPVEQPEVAARSSGTRQERTLPPTAVARP
ncbi:MAG TPA: universal stress protein [Gaiellaceae bacterium]|jgi:nucleotide-binding universal stress UspA family protein